MSDYATYGTIATNGATFTLSPTIGKELPKAPSGLIATRAVETKDGWLGQVLVDKEIVFEGKPHKYGEGAIDEANRRVVRAIRRLFTSGADNE